MPLPEMEREAFFTVMSLARSTSVGLSREFRSSETFSEEVGGGVCEFLLISPWLVARHSEWPR